MDTNQPQTPVQPQPPVTPVPSPVNSDWRLKVKGMFERVKTWWNGLAIPPILKKVLLGVLVTFLVVLVLGIIFSIVRGLGGGRKPQVIATPTPQALETPSTEIITNPSRYATDSGIIKIGEDINALDRDLNSADMKEDNLKPPILDYDIKF